MINKKRKKSKVVIPIIPNKIKLKQDESEIVSNPDDDFSSINIDDISDAYETSNTGDHIPCGEINIASIITDSTNTKHPKVADFANSTSGNIASIPSVPNVDNISTLNDMIRTESSYAKHPRTAGFANIANIQSVPNVDNISTLNDMIRTESSNAKHAKIAGFANITSDNIANIQSVPDIDNISTLSDKNGFIVSNDICINGVSNNINIHDMKFEIVDVGADNIDVGDDNGIANIIVRNDEDGEEVTTTYIFAAGASDEWDDSKFLT